MDPQAQPTMNLAPAATNSMPTAQPMTQPSQSSDPKAAQFNSMLNYMKTNPNDPLSYTIMNKIKGGQMNDYLQAAGYNPSQFVNQAPERVAPPTSTTPSLGDTNKAVLSFGSDVANSFKGAQSSMSDVAERQLAGKQNIGETILQGLGVGAKLGNDIIGSGIKSLINLNVPQPVQDAIGSAISTVIQSSPAIKTGLEAAKSGMDRFDAWAKTNPKDAQTISSLINIPLFAAQFVGAGEAPGAIKAVAPKVGEIASDARGIIPAIKTTDPLTEEAIANIAKQEGGIVAPAKTASQVAQEMQQKTWDVIKPRLTPSQIGDAAASGNIARVGETGVVTHVPTSADLPNIKLAQPYVEAAAGDPLKTVSNIKQGIANEAAKLRNAVGTQGGTFSTSNVKGVLDKVRVPLAIKDSAEMTQVNNIKNYVAELASKVDKNPAGALDLSQQFRRGINSEFGENIWGKGTPISNYIKSVNKALNDFISTRLPEGRLPDGTLIKDSFTKQSKLYDIMDNIQLPKLGDAAINPTEEDALKIPGSPLSETIKEFGKNHPITKGAIKAAGRAAGIGAGVHIIP